MKIPRMIASALSSLVIACALAGCITPDNSYLMELNRSGRWREVERIGYDMLENRASFTHSQSCETYFHVIYAQTRMGKKSDAVRLMGEYESFRVKATMAPELLWLGREIAILKGELGLLDDAQRALVSAMEENGKGNYILARKLLDEVIAMSGANDAQKATAHFVAAVCSIRLKDRENAEIHFLAFDELKAALPPDHQTLREEAFARRGLDELK